MKAVTRIKSESDSKISNYEYNEYHNISSFVDGVATTSFIEKNNLIDRNSSYVLCFKVDM